MLFLASLVPDTFAHYPFTLIAISAFFHAITNILIKASKDPQIARAMMGLVSAIIALPFLPFVALPSPTTWGWLIASGLIHFVYQSTLIKAYRLGDFSAVYPIARGSAPMLTTLGAIFWLGDSVPLLAIIGILMIAIAMGVIGRGAGGRAGREAVVFAIATGICIALYTLVDAQGMRSTDDLAPFVLWLFIIDGITTCGYATATRGIQVFNLTPVELTKGVAAGLLSASGYAAALIAFKFGPLAELAALRETSVIYGAVLGVIIFKERLGPTRIAAATAIAAGAVLVRMA
jgi:drug/metabolite transporter (DMT)-like permease